MRKTNIIFIISLISLFFIVGCTNPPSPTPSPTPEIPSEVYEARDWAVSYTHLTNKKSLTIKLINSNYYPFQLDWLIKNLRLPDML